MKYFLSLSEAPAALKAKLVEAMKLKSAWDSHKQELAQIVADLARLHQDQDRIRKNLANTPREAEVYTVYLKKLSDQEKEIDGLTANQKQRMADEFAAKKSYEDYLANLTE
jgi:septal ring factor EnvC (AmiA/AmiB activator)